MKVVSVDREQPAQRSHLFTLRLWQEALGDGESDWRGKIQHVISGEARYFRGWPALEAFLEEVAGKVDAEAAQPSGARATDGPG